MFLVSPIFHCHKIKDGGYNNITNTNKVSPTQNTPALQARKEPRNWLMVRNIPFGSYQPEWKDYLKTYSSIFGWNFRKVTIYLPSGISEIFCQMVSTPGLSTFRLESSSTPVTYPHWNSKVKIHSVRFVGGVSLSLNIILILFFEGTYTPVIKMCFHDIVKNIFLP